MPIRLSLESSMTRKRSTPAIPLRDRDAPLKAGVPEKRGGEAFALDRDQFGPYPVWLNLGAVREPRKHVPLPPLDELAVRRENVSPLPGVERSDVVLGRVRRGRGDQTVAAQKPCGAQLAAQTAAQVGDSLVPISFDFWGRAPGFWWHGDDQVLELCTKPDDGARLPRWLTTESRRPVVGRRLPNYADVEGF